VYNSVLHKKERVKKLSIRTKWYVEDIEGKLEYIVLTADKNKVRKKCIISKTEEEEIIEGTMLDKLSENRLSECVVYKNEIENCGIYCI
jgi:hypothetical protein